MFNIGGAELLVILLVALLVLGPNKLPQAARQVGHFLGEFRRIADGFQQELKTAMDVDDKPVATNLKKKPTEKPQSPGGPTDQTVIDADSTDSTETDSTETDSTEIDSTETDSTEIESTESDSTGGAVEVVDETGTLDDPAAPAEPVTED